MPKADTNSTRFAPAKFLSDRRSFMALVTSAAIVATAQRANARLADDSALLKLEEQIFDLYEKATAYDDEIYRLHQIWVGKYKRLAEEQSDLTREQQCDLVSSMPECKEHTRLVKLQDPFYEKMDILVKEMFATPAKTSEGRRAKATVLLSIIMPHGWQDVDKDTDYPELMARNLLIEFIGGEPGEMLRGQFA